MQIREASAYAFAPPAIMGLGTSTGFDLQLVDRGGSGHAGLIDARNRFLQAAASNPAMMAVRPGGQDDMPQLRIDIDNAKAGSLGLSVSDIDDVLGTAWGGAYVDDFIDQGRVKKVYVQADAPYRMSPDDLGRWHVRNAEGEMVPFGAFAAMHWEYGSPRLERYNGAPSVEIQGQAAPGRSSGDAMAAAEQIASQLPPGFAVEWTGVSLQERTSGAQAPALYAVSMLVVFLCLAALYESWSVPISVMLVVPLGVIGAVLATSLRGLSNDVYFQVGLLTTIGLAAKNAILIVEFAKSLYEKEGRTLLQAAAEACRIRLRPILMTSLAFGMGVLPLAISVGAGSGARHAIGTGVLGGMATATLFGIFFVPMFFVVALKLSGADRKRSKREG
jgi:multidrug efflux pump